MATERDTDVHLLRAWRLAGGEIDAAAVGSSPDALAARVKALREAGYGLEVLPGGRYRIVSSPAHLIADDLRAGLPEHALIGREILVFKETDSTNDLAARAGRDGIGEGLVIFAESQRAGRGRLGRRWVSPAGRNLLFSVLLRPAAVLAQRWDELTFCAALAVAETAERCTGRPARIKWPNDVLVAGRKVAGILLESHRGYPPGFVVMGIGLNVLQEEEDFPLELRARAASLAMLMPLANGVRARPGRREVALEVLERLERYYAAWREGAADVREECLRRGGAAPSVSPDDRQETRSPGNEAAACGR